MAVALRWYFTFDVDATSSFDVESSSIIRRAATRFCCGERWLIEAADIKLAVCWEE